MSSPPLDSDYAEQRRSRTRTGTIVASDDKYLSRSGGPILDRSRPRSHSAAPSEIADRDRLERTPSQRSRFSSFIFFFFFYLPCCCCCCGSIFGLLLLHAQHLPRQSQESSSSIRAGPSQFISLRRTVRTTIHSTVSND